MKKLRTTLAVNSFIVGILSFSMFTSCTSPSEKVEAAQDSANIANENLSIAQQNEAEAEEWKTFKIEANVTIKQNELKIAELRVKMHKSDNSLSAVYQTRIDTLEKSNEDLKVRISTYDKNHSDWATFKKDFNKDLNDLGQAIKDVSTNNK